jgi:hypothetical protein
MDRRKPVTTLLKKSIMSVSRRLVRSGLGPVFAPRTEDQTTGPVPEKSGPRTGPDGGPDQRPVLGPVLDQTAETLVTRPWAGSFHHVETAYANVSLKNHPVVEPCAFTRRTEEYTAMLARCPSQEREDTRRGERVRIGFERDRVRLLRPKTFRLGRVRPCVRRLRRLSEPFSVFTCRSAHHVVRHRSVCRICDHGIRVKTSAGQRVIRSRTSPARPSRSPSPLSFVSSSFAGRERFTWNCSPLCLPATVAARQLRRPKHAPIHRGCPRPLPRPSAHPLVVKSQV